MNAKLFDRCTNLRCVCAHSEGINECGFKLKDRDAGKSTQRREQGRQELDGFGGVGSLVLV